MISVYTVLYTLVLFAELSSHSVTAAMPATKAEDPLITDQDGLSLVLAEEQMMEPMNEPAVVAPSYRRSLVLDNNPRDEDGQHGRPRIIIVSDMRLRGHSIGGLNPGFSRGLSLLTDRSLSHTPAVQSLKIDRRNTDMDMLRCMIGRVYRPCWDV